LTSVAKLGRQKIEVLIFSPMAGTFFHFLLSPPPSSRTAPCPAPPRPQTTSQIIGSHSQLGRLLPPNAPVRLESDGQFYQGSYTTCLPNRPSWTAIQQRDCQRWHWSPWLSLPHARPRRCCIGCLGRRSREEDSRTSGYSPIKEERESLVN
jgi:hypothetical protein